MVHHERLRTSEIKPLLWKLAVPAIIGMTFNALYNIVDGIFVGLATGEKGIAAISIVMPIMYITFAVALMLGIGSASIYSRAIGARDHEKARDVGQSTLTHILVISVLYTLIGVTFGEQIAYAFGMQDSFFAETMNYFNVIFYGTPFLFYTVYWNNMFRAEGRAKIAMMGMVIGTVTNIVLDPILIFGFDMGTLGAAIATVVGYIVSMIYLYYQQTKTSYDFTLRVKELHWNNKVLIESSSIGFAAFIRNTTGSLLVIVVNNLLVRHAVDPVMALAVFGIFMRIQMFFLMPTLGVNQAMMPIAGFNYGAKQFERVKEVRNYSVKVMYLYMIFVYVVYFIFARQFLLMFGFDGETLLYGMFYTRMSFVGWIFIAVQIMLTGYYQALGRPKFAIFLALLRQIIIFIPLSIVLSQVWGEFGVWLALPVSDLLSSTIGWYFLLLEDRRFKREYAV